MIKARCAVIIQIWMQCALELFGALLFLSSTWLVKAVFQTWRIADYYSDGSNRALYILCTEPSNIDAPVFGEVNMILFNKRTTLVRSEREAAEWS